MTCQDQLVHGSGDQQTPALKLLRGTHPGLRPQEILLEKAIGVFVRKATLVGADDLFERKRGRANPDKPAFPALSPALLNVEAQDTENGQIDLPCLTEMQTMLCFEVELGVRLFAYRGVAYRAVLE